MTDLWTFKKNQRDFENVFFAKNDKIVLALCTSVLTKKFLVNKITNDSVKCSLMSICKTKEVLKQVIVRKPGHKLQIKITVDISTYALKWVKFWLQF